MCIFPIAKSGSGANRALPIAAERERLCQKRTNAKQSPHRPKGVGCGCIFSEGWRCGALQKASLARAGNRLGAAGDAQLAEDIARVPLHRGVRQYESIGNLMV